MEADVDGEEDYAVTSSAHDDDIYFFDDNLFEPDDNADASGSDDNDASDEVGWWDDAWLTYKDEDGEEDDLDLEDEPNVNGKKRSYLRTNY